MANVQSAAQRTRLENFRRLTRTGPAEWMQFTLDIGGLPGLTELVMARFRRQTGAERPEEFFDYDFRLTSLEAHFARDNPVAVHLSVELGTVFDEWGIRHWAGGTAGSVEKAFPSLASATSIADVESTERENHNRKLHEDYWN
jgi:hypothetical protein